MAAANTLPYPSSDDLKKPFEHALDVVAHDTNELTFVTRGLMVTTAGDVTVVMIGGETVLLPGLLPGTVYPHRVKQVKITGTATTAGIKGFY